MSRTNFGVEPEKEYNKKLNEIIYVSLTEHIHGAIERYHQGIQVKNPLLMEIKRLFADEYEIGRRALEMIHQDFGVLFEEDEAGYIAYHIVNAELNNDMINIANITKVMQQVLSVIKYHFKVEFNEESSTYYRFITHLKFLLLGISFIFQAKKSFSSWFFSFNI